MSGTIAVKERAWRLFVVVLLAFGTHRLLVHDLPQPKDVSKDGDMSLHELASQYRESGCPVHRFESISLLSRSPLMILIEGFVTLAEAAAIVQIAEPHFSDSTVGADRSRSKGRRSQSAFLKAPAKFNRSDADMIVHCIEARASEFQGYIPIDDMETLQVVKYDHHGMVKCHYDWLPPTVPSMKWAGNRQSSFFVYLQVDCKGGTTVFPEIPRPPAIELCDALKCQNETGGEVTWMEIKPAVGRAVFWYNLDVRGRGDPKTLHAGMPVFNGTKVGMNIWTRERSWRRWVVPEN